MTSPIFLIVQQQDFLFICEIGGNMDMETAYGCPYWSPIL